MAVVVLPETGDPNQEENLVCGFGFSGAQRLHRLTFILEAPTFHIDAFPAQRVMQGT